MNIATVRVRSVAEMRLAAKLCTALAKVAALEAQNDGLRTAIEALKRQDSAETARLAEREACARAIEDLGFAAGAKRIRDRTASETFARRPLNP